MFLIPLIIFILNTVPLYEVEEIVVTATRYPSALRDIAQATTVIEKEEIEQLPALTISHILEMKAGIDMKNYGNPGAVSSTYLRGIPSNATLILVNGHPLNTITTGIADLSAINIDEIQRIEIVKGPVSSFYGANGVGGVINIITAKNYIRPETELKVMTSSADIDQLLQSKYLFARVGTPLGRTQLDMSGAYTVSDGYRSNSDLEHHHLQGNFVYDRDRIQLAAHITYDDKEYGVPGPQPRIDSLHALPRLGDSTATSLFDREHDRLTRGNITFDWHASDHVRVHAKILGDRTSLTFHTAYEGGLADTIVVDYDYLTHSLGVQSFATVAHDDIQVALGCDVQYDTLQTERTSVHTGDTTWHASSSVIGTWLELKKDFGSITVMPRLRFDNNSEYGAFFSPGLGIVSAVTHNVWAKISLERAFRAPTFNDRYWPQGGNPELKPEKAWAYEFRLEASPVHQLFTACSFFMRQVQDRIVWLPTESSLWQPQNANFLDIRGIDIEVRSQVHEILGVSLEGTYLHAQQKNNEVVYNFYDWVADTGRTIIEEIERDAAFTPQYRLSAGVVISVPGDIVLALTGMLVAEQVNYYPNYEDYPHVSMDEKVLDGYSVMHLDAKKSLFNVLTCGVGVRNLFDVDYATQFGFTIDDLDYPMPGRLVYAHVTWRM